jgi:hypothetical protein
MYAQRTRVFTTHAFAHYNLHCWFCFITGKSTMIDYVRQGQRILWEHPSNPEYEDPQKQYILCITRDEEVSQRLGASDRGIEVVPTEWWGHIFLTREVKAKLTDLQKQMAYLLVMGYDRHEIAARLFAKRKKKDGSAIKAPLGCADQCQRAIIARMRKHYKITDNDAQSLRRVLEENVQEVRPAIVPIYQKAS